MILLFVFSAFFIYAQDYDESDGGYEEDIELEDKLIFKVIYTGLKKVRPRELIAVQVTKEGMPFDASLLEQDYKNFFELDYFEDVIVKADKAVDPKTNLAMPGYINIIYEFQEKPTIRKIIFNGNDSIAYGYLIGDVSIKKGDFFRKSEVVADIYNLKEKYQKKGYNYVNIDYEVVENEELKLHNQVDIVFNVDEGVETYVSEIAFEGISKFTPQSLKAKMKTKERAFLGLQKGVFLASDFYQDIEDLTKYYKDQGFYFAEILEPEVNRLQIEEDGKKREIIKIKITVKEGSQYRYGGMEITGNKIFSTDDLTYNLKLKPGAILNHSKLQEDLYSLTKQYNDSGYVETQVAQDTVVDEENKTISFKIFIQESKLSYIEAVYFKGNTKTKNYVLYRAVYTQVGQIFDSSKLISSVYALHNLGFFSKVEPDIKPGSAPGLLKITYVLEEQSTAEVRFGVQVTTNNWPPEITLFGQVSERNFLGRELVISGKVDLALSEQGFTFSISDPWFLNYPWSMGASLEFYHNWYQKVYRKLTVDDYQAYMDENSNQNPSEDNVRDWYNTKYSNDTQNNPNYVGYGKDKYWEMGVSDLTIEMAFNTGYRFLKYFSIYGEYSLKPIYTFMMDNSLVSQVKSTSYRSMMSNNGGWSIRSRLAATFSINTTKRRINPYEGIKFSTTAAYTWGHFDMTSLSAKFTAYWKILDIMLGDWPFKHVVVFNAAASFIFPGFRNLGGVLNGKSTKDKGPIVYPDDYLQVDGIFAGRGWANSIGATNSTGRLTNKTGYARFDYSLEYRIPIHENFIWFAAFVDMINLVEGPMRKIPTVYSDGNIVSSYSYSDDANSWQWWNQTESNRWYDDRMTNWYGVDNWYGSVGLGFQITFQQLPLSFYVVKRFKINGYSGFEWVCNQPDTGNLDFVISIVGYYF
ncbi:MAG: outer membrane protein assembly factor BamA [Spirochaetales bacterium]|nr:outer membrane protein assembly factor BamA [Spirochaetales bacterium]